MARFTFGKKASIAAAIIVAFLLAGCAGTRGGHIPYDVKDFSLPDPTEAAIRSDDYIISNGDKLNITVFQVDTLSHDYNVDLAGNISMPLIGTVPAVGHTVAQLRDDIARRLGEHYLRKPDVTISLTESVGRNITIDGSVRQPGRFPVRGSLTLMEAVALAQGLDQDANAHRVAVFRRTGGQRVAAAFDLTSIRRGEEADPTVYAGDVVIVDGTRTRALLTNLFTAIPLIALFRPY